MNNAYFHFKYRILYFVFTIVFFLFTFSSFSQKTKKIELKHANSLEFDKALGIDAKRLLGNVAFEHEGILMFCDSAYLYTNNSLDAFGNIHIQQGDSVHLYGDLLKYDGNEKKAIVQNNVRLLDKDMVLTTDVLYYDTKEKVANYQTGAKIVNKENILTSNIGYYYSYTKDFIFNKQVVLTNPEYVMNSDTLKYNTETKTAYFFGPSTIKGKDNFIYCENGWYNTSQNTSQFSKHAYLLSKEQKLSSDSLYYDREKGIGRAFKNVEIIDTIQKIKIKGDYGEYFEFTGQSTITKNAVLIQVYDKDTLFLHADTLRTEYEKISSNVNSLKFKVAIEQKKQKTKYKVQSTKNTEHRTQNTEQDTLKGPRIMLAYHKVKFFKSDMQGKCDSLVYTFKDSSMHMFTDPVLWSDKNQLTAERMELKLRNEKLYMLYLKDLAFITSIEDTSKYNQIKGKVMKGYFVENKLRKIKVEGNGQTVYYAKDGDKMIGVNKADCTDMLIFLNDSQVDKITFITKPDATLYPTNELQPNELLLKGFSWQVNKRPLSKKDIFLW